MQRECLKLLKNHMQSPGHHCLEVDSQIQADIAHYLKTHGAVLLTEWITPKDWYVLYLQNKALICIQSKLHPTRPALTDLSHDFPVTNRLQRAIYDLTKIPTQHAQDKRPWLNHGYFPTGVLNAHARSQRSCQQSYPFNKVAGDGVHEIPVGPVHAGVIEPGHFRFSVVGERILKLEERFGYTHKGIHQLLLNQDIQQGAKLISRVSGDSTVAYAYAYALACEDALNHSINPQTQIMRTVLLERERLINHIGDMAAIVNDAGMPSLQSQFSILKETLVRDNQQLTGHRYMMDAIMPCQNIPLWNSDTITTVLWTLNKIQKQLHELKQICDHHHGLQDRLKTTGGLSIETAKQLGVIGFTARASGLKLDMRQGNTHYPYSALNITALTESNGDVAARMNLRFKECHQSIDVIHRLFDMVDQASTTNEPHATTTDFPFGVGIVESWRGPVCVAVALEHDQIQWCHFHDPSWQNWLALEYAVIGNIVADFPLINKSFNLSYSGQDS